MNYDAENVKSHEAHKLITSWELQAYLHTHSVSYPLIKNKDSKTFIEHLEII